MRIAYGTARLGPTVPPPLLAHTLMGGDRVVILFGAVHESFSGTKRKCFRAITVVPGIEGSADMDVSQPELGEEDCP